MELNLNSTKKYLQYWWKDRVQPTVVLEIWCDINPVQNIVNNHQQRCANTLSSTLNMKRTSA